MRPKTSRESNKKGAAKLEFAATRHWKMTVEGLTNKGESSVRLVQSRRKLLPTDTQKLFRAISECECSAYPNGLLTNIIHPCLLHLQPAAASSRLRPPRPGSTSCSTSPLRSHLQFREAPTPPAPITSFARSPKYARCPPPPQCFPLPHSL
jgi:hypothetical protein